MNYGLVPYKNKQPINIQLRALQNEYSICKMKSSIAVFTASEAEKT